MSQIALELTEVLTFLFGKRILAFFYSTCRLGPLFFVWTGPLIFLCSKITFFRKTEIWVFNLHLGFETACNRRLYAILKNKENHFLLQTFVDPTDAITKFRKMCPLFLAWISKTMKIPLRHHSKMKNLNGPNMLLSMLICFFKCVYQGVSCRPIVLNFKKIVLCTNLDLE